jgi:hypothetical protein
VGGFIFCFFEFLEDGGEDGAGEDEGFGEVQFFLAEVFDDLVGEFIDFCEALIGEEFQGFGEAFRGGKEHTFDSVVGV